MKAVLGKILKRIIMKAFNIMFKTPDLISATLLRLNSARLVMEPIKMPILHVNSTFSIQFSDENKINKAIT